MLQSNQGSGSPYHCSQRKVCDFLVHVLVFLLCVLRYSFQCFCLFSRVIQLRFGSLKVGVLLVSFLWGSESCSTWSNRNQACKGSVSTTSFSPRVRQKLFVSSNTAGLKRGGHFTQSYRCQILNKALLSSSSEHRQMSTSKPDKLRFIVWVIGTTSRTLSMGPTRRLSFPQRDLGLN